MKNGTRMTQIEWMKTDSVFCFAECSCENLFKFNI